MPAPQDTGKISKPPHLLIQAKRALCPQCGNSSMFSGWIAFRHICPSCGLNYDRYNVGDGPAAFLTLIIGAIVCALALALEFTVFPPFWVHVLIWPIVITILVIGLLRLSKAALLIEEHRKSFREGRLAATEDDL
jgi:uncharacterized protein (DUF983 family)